MNYVNRTAHREFEVLNSLEAGIQLTGSEVKAIRTRGIKLDEAYVKLVNGKLLLVNAHIPQYEYSREEDYAPTRSRALLIKRRETIHLSNKLSQGSNLTIIPLRCYNKKGLIKLEIALAKGRKNWEIKKIEQNRDETRRVEKEIKEYIKK